VAVVVVMSVMVWRSVVMVIVMHVVVWRSVVVIMRGSSVGPIQTCMVPMTAMVATVMTMIHFYLNFSQIISNEWREQNIRGPQCAFEMSMFMCPSVHKLTRN
jgi:hypothetical protein